MPTPEQQLHFGFEKSAANQRLFVDVPGNVLAAVESRQAMHKRLRFLRSVRVRCVDVEEGDTASRLYINYKKIGGIQDDMRKRRTIYTLGATLNDFQAFAQDPHITADFGTEPTDLGHLSLFIDVQWPNRQEDVHLQTVATTIMRDSARKLRYVSPSLIPDLVYAQVHRPTQVSLIVNDMGGCEASTYGGFYKPASPRFELSAGNLYHPDMQLICFSGGVALAHAPEIELS